MRDNKTKTGLIAVGVASAVGVLAYIIYKCFKCVDDFDDLDFDEYDEYFENATDYEMDGLDEEE